MFTLVHRCCVWWCHSPKDEEAAVGRSRGSKNVFLLFHHDKTPFMGSPATLLPPLVYAAPPPPPPPRPCQRKFVNTFAVKRTRSRITSIGVSGNRDTGISKPGQFLWLTRKYYEKEILLPSILPKNKLENFNFCLSLHWQKVFVRFWKNWKNHGHGSRTKIQYKNRNSVLMKHFWWTPNWFVPNLDPPKTIWDRPKQFGPVQNCFGPNEGPIFYNKTWFVVQ